jgi:hypothetical protein
MRRGAAPSVRRSGRGACPRGERREASRSTVRRRYGAGEGTWGVREPWTGVRGHVTGWSVTPARSPRCAHQPCDASPIHGPASSTSSCSTWRTAASAKPCLCRSSSAHVCAGCSSSSCSVHRRTVCTGPGPTSRPNYALHLGPSKVLW